jgi:colanic acid/amylovoran biosynthesis protein
MNRPLRIATFAVPLSGNKGSASMFLGLRDAFQDANIEVEFFVFSYYPQRDDEMADRLPNVSVHPGHPKHIAFQLIPLMLLALVLPFLVPKRWRQHLKAMKSADLVLLMGGTTFADSMLYKVPWNVMAALPGYLLRKPTVFVSQTMGPFAKSLNRWAARWTLCRAAAVHGRGRTSAANVESLGVRNGSYEPDLSCCLKVPSFEEVAARESIVGQLALEINAARQSGKAIVGITPNSIVYDKAAACDRDYIAFLTSAVEAIHERGCLPVLIPHSYRNDVRKLHNNDRAICTRVRDSISGTTQCFYLDQDLSSADLRAVIGQMDLLVASRFHSMVSALMMGVTPMTYGWGDQKYREVLTEFDAEDLFIPYQELDADQFPARFDSVFSQRESYAARIKAAKPTVVQGARSLPLRLLALVDPDMAGDLNQTAPQTTQCDSDVEVAESSLRDLELLLKDATAIDQSEANHTLVADHLTFPALPHSGPTEVG